MIEKKLTRWYFKILDKKFWIISAVILFCIYFANTLHTNFSDEFDNIVGGYYITRGILPYIGFFSHHNPGAYFIASIITIFTKQSFVAFRIVWGIVLYISAIGFYGLLGIKIGFKRIRFYVFYLFLLGISATYYWGQMLLSETIVGYLLIPAYALVLLKNIYGIRYSYTDIIFLSITTFISLLTSLTFVFAIIILIAMFLYGYQRQSKFLSKNMFHAVIIFLIPYLLFAIYLIITQSIKEFYFQSILYNRNYYIYNFPVVSGQVSKHPLRYALSILFNTSLQFQVLSLQIKNLNFDFPVNVTLLVGNISLLGYLICKKKYSLAILIYLFMVYLNSRGEPLASKETDFHSTVYIMFSLFNICFVLFHLYKNIREETNKALSFIYKGLLVLTAIYSFYSIGILLRLFADKTYTKIMGQAPLIYDRPVAAPIINRIVKTDEYYWIGPFEFEELLYINAKLPSKYHWFLPAHERSDKIKEEFLADLHRNRPKLIVFKEDLGYFGTDPKDFNYPIVNLLRKEYFRLEDLEKEGKKYRPTLTNLHNFDMAVNFYYDKNRKEEIISLLINEGLIKIVTP